LSNHRVQKFTSKGILVTKWGYENTGGEGASRRPHQLAINSGGRAFLTTRANSEILVFDSDGKFLTKWGSKGTADGTMQKPEDLAINPMTGDVYVTDTKNSRIQKFSEVR
jgi:tripartite motif-containing protein 71